MNALHLLQKHDIGVELPQSLAQVVHHHVPVRWRKAFVNIPGSDGNMGGGARWRCP
jgi:hypothetical protein